MSSVRLAWALVLLAVVALNVAFFVDDTSRWWNIGAAGFAAGVGMVHAKLWLGG